LALQL